MGHCYECIHITYDVMGNARCALKDKVTQQYYYACNDFEWTINKKGEDMVEQAEGKYYVYGFWHIYPTKEIVTKDGVKEITEFGNIDDALAFIKKRSEENINITYCICRDRCYVEKELKGK